MKNTISKNGAFTLIEAMLVMVIVAITFLGFGYLFGNISQSSITEDITIVAIKLARDKMDEVIAHKADGGYDVIASEGQTAITVGSWPFERQTAVTYINPTTFVTSGSDTGYKKVVVGVSWGVLPGQSVALTTLVGDSIPSGVGGGYAQCP